MYDDAVIMNKAQLIEYEVERLIGKYKKEYFDFKDLTAILGVGRDNVRALMASEGFPVVRIGNRKVVSVLSYVLWQMEKDDLTCAHFRGNM